MRFAAVGIFSPRLPAAGFRAIDLHGQALSRGEVVSASAYLANSRFRLGRREPPGRLKKAQEAGRKYAQGGFASDHFKSWPEISRQAKAPFRLWPRQLKRGAERHLTRIAEPFLVHRGLSPDNSAFAVAMI
jgi:hypothetical protein